ncbi:Meiotic activator RIM4 [Lasiodiplodia hormozganensis]|uniref:Meiotic activator RIM4 n=1 Tax=Lasiodiplodia hormozganensis TaxID=869390 RepID=A0AA40D5K2_9PEZI|nr:Meiotic activator RIM4 [Lasiodiplodia hormozganensis]
MDQVTPPSSSHGKHRRTRSTPDRMSGGSSDAETALNSPIAPSTPFSPLEQRAGVNVPDTPLSPLFDDIADHDGHCRVGSSEEIKGSPKPTAATGVYEYQIFLTNPDEEPTPMVVKQDGKTPFEKKDFVPIANHRRVDRRRLNPQRPHLVPSRSDPAGVHAMSGSHPPQFSDNPFMQSYPEPAVSSESSHPELSTDSEDFVPGPLLSKIDARNAQAKLSPEACLFVASLRKDKSDQEIYAALVKEFSKHGTCYIKVKRNRELPIAFIQYHEKDKADMAMERASGALILERPCRIEKARAPRSVFVSRRDGKTPSRAEVVQLLQMVGQVDKMWALSEIDMERFALAPGFCCRFAFYQDSVDAITRYRDHLVYDVESFLAPEKSHQPTFDWGSVLSEPNRSSTTPNFDFNIHMRNALWVGGLPPSVTKSELMRVFFNQRRVVSNVDIRIRTAAPSTNEASYAVIYFADDQSALDAALCTHRKLRLHTGERVRIQWAFKNFLRNFGRGHTSGPKNYHDCAAGTHFGNHSSFFPGDANFGRGPQAFPLPTRAVSGYPRPAGEMSSPNGAFVNGAGHFHMANVMGQHAAQQAFVNGQVYGVYPGPMAESQANNGHVANRATPSTAFAGYPVVNGTYHVCSRFPSRL